MGGKNAFTGEPLYDTWVECKRSVCSDDAWLRASPLPSTCDPTDLSTFTMDYHVYVICPVGGGGFEIYGLDSGSLQWAAVQLSLPPAPALPSPRYQDTQFATLSYSKPQLAARAKRAQHLRGDAGAGGSTEPLSSQGGCLVALTGGPNVVSSTGSTFLSVTNDGRTWRTYTTPILSRSNAAIAPFQATAQGYGLGIFGGIGANGQYLGDSWILDGQLCCASACDPATGVNCTICNGHGTCVADGQQICACDVGWSGDFCMQSGPTQTATATATSTSTVGSSQSSTATSTASATATATVGTSASSTGSASPSRGSSSSPTPSISFLPAPAQPPKGIVPGLDETGGLSVIVVSSLAGTVLLMGAFWKVVACVRAAPSVAPTQVSVPAWH